MITVSPNIAHFKFRSVTHLSLKLGCLCLTSANGESLAVRHFKSADRVFSSRRWSDRMFE